MLEGTMNLEQYGPWALIVGGSEGIGASFVPRTFDRDVADEIMMVDDRKAFTMVRRLAAEEGLLGGSSTGAILHAALEIAERLGPGKRIATIVPDSAERYLSKKIFEEQ